jgi:hypothetical protein
MLGVTDYVVVSSKKQRELSIIVNFARAAGLDFEMVEIEREAPDFIVKFDGRHIGVEVTELFIGGDHPSMQPQARTSIGYRISTRARSRYEELGGKPLHVTIGLALGDELRGANRDHMAEYLAQFLLELDPPSGHVVSWRPSYESDPLPAEVRYLNVLAVPTRSMAHWHVPESGWVAPLEESVLQAKVDEKAQNLGTYKQAVSEIWLVMGTLGWSASQFLEVRSDLRPERITSPFARTYYFSGFEGRVLRLGPARDA